jgi:hypothetical protein
MIRNEVIDLGEEQHNSEVLFSLPHIGICAVAPPFPQGILSKTGVDA